MPSAEGPNCCICFLPQLCVFVSQLFSYFSFCSCFSSGGVRCLVSLHSFFRFLLMTWVFFSLFSRKVIIISHDSGLSKL